MASEKEKKLMAKKNGPNNEGSRGMKEVSQEKEQGRSDADKRMIGVESLL